MKKNPVSPKPKVNKENSMWPSRLTDLLRMLKEKNLFHCSFFISENFNHLLMLCDESSDGIKLNTA
jgi:hypothetical protein